MPYQTIKPYTFQCLIWGDDRLGTATQKALLARMAFLALACDDPHGWMTVTYQELADACGCSRPTVARLMPALVAAGYLEHQQDVQANQYQAGRYRLSGAAWYGARVDAGADITDQRADITVIPAQERADINREHGADITMSKRVRSTQKVVAGAPASASGHNRKELPAANLPAAQPDAATPGGAASSAPGTSETAERQDAMQVSAIPAEAPDVPDDGEERIPTDRQRAAMVALVRLNAGITADVQSLALRHRCPGCGAPAGRRCNRPATCRERRALVDISLADSPGRDADYLSRQAARRIVQAVSA